VVKAPSWYKRKTHSNGYIYEHRYIVEEILGRYLKENEVVHHRDEDKLNNEVDNLEVKDKKTHDGEHTAMRGRAVVSLRCPTCGVLFDRDRRTTHLVKGGRATFCSRRCIGGFRGFSRGSKMNNDDRNALKKNVIREFIKIPG